MAARTPSCSVAKRVEKLMPPSARTIDELKEACKERKIDTKKCKKVDDYKKLLNSYCVSNPLLSSGEHAVSIESMCLDQVNHHLAQRTVVVPDDMPLGERRAILTEQLEMEKRWAHLKVMVRWTGAEKGSFFDDPKRVLYCCLHR
jgi:hypothetical protein